MRILFLSNFYPPASRGGYEQWCQEVLESLRRRGHDVRVVTSDYGKSQLLTPDPGWVERSLHLEMELSSFKNAFQFFTHRKKHELENLNRISRLIADFKPDTMLVWGMWNLQRSIAALAEELLPERVAYYMGDYWPFLPNQFENYWKAPARNLLTGLPKLILKPFALRTLALGERIDLKFQHVLFATSFMQEEYRQKGLSPRNSKVIYGAVDTKPYLNEHKKSDNRLSLLSIGRLNLDKGIHTAIEAMGCLVRDNIRDLHLTIVGDGESEYKAHLRDLIARENVTSFVELLSAQPKDTLPALYQQADIFLFTSIWPEPFGRVIVEAMASGVTVIGTKVGGAAEILVENENALTFPAGDAKALAEQIKRLIASPELRKRLSQAGKETAVNKFDLERMTTEIESYLESLVKS